VEAVNSDSNVNVSIYISERDKYKTEFNSWSKKTAQSTLEMCRVVYEAKKELASQDFLKFCNEIGRKGEDATVRKYLRIGEKYDKFYQYAELLPNSWTSIYEITQLPSETFEALVATEYSMANMTGDQLKQLMGKKTEDKSRSSAASVDTTTTAVPQTSKTEQNTPQQPEITDTLPSQSDVFQARAAASADTSSASDHEFAKQATNTMLERVVATASTTVEIEAEEVFVPYEITLRFNSKPTDDAVAALVESLMTIKSKYRLDFEFVQQNAFSM
jgi:hypothetical protein